MVGEETFILEKGNLSFFLCNRFPDMATAESVFLFRWRRRDRFVVKLIFTS